MYELIALVIIAIIAYAVYRVTKGLIWLLVCGALAVLVLFPSVFPSATGGLTFFDAVSIVWEHLLGFVRSLV